MDRNRRDMERYFKSIFIHRTIWIEIGGFRDNLFLSIGLYG